MRHRFGTWMAVAILCMAATTSFAQLAPYSQDFEGLDAGDTGALAADGWLVFGNVFDPGFNYLYGYGPFAAPNDGAAFCAIASGEGGPDQGVQQITVYSDYNNGDHGNGNLIEANVFQEQVVSAADVGNTWVFAFDAKKGNLEGATTALAFFKTLDPNNGFALTNFITADMTGIPNTWGNYFLTIEIDPSLEGQILQFGFLSVATNYEGSGIIYDNINFAVGTGACCRAPNSTRFCQDDMTRNDCEGVSGLFVGERTICDGSLTCDSLAVTMESMSAVATRGGVQISWTTATELDTVGFRILRETVSSEKRLDVVNPMIPAMGSDFNGGSYQFLDNSKPASKAVHYYIEDVGIFGKVTRHGPIVVERGQPHRVKGDQRVAPRR